MFDLQLSHKLMFTLAGAALFIAVSLPQTFKFTNGLLGKFVGPLASAAGCPTMTGLAVHAVVFFLVTKYVLMRNTLAHDSTKTKRALFATLLFLVVACPYTYKLVRSVAGSSIASAEGCPTMTGIVLHSAVFAAVQMIAQKKLHL